jgi:hypothetical protein
MEKPGLPPDRHFSQYLISDVPEIGLGDGRRPIRRFACFRMGFAGCRVRFILQGLFRSV